LGTFGAELFLSRVSFVLLLAGLIIFFHGWPLFSSAAFPVGVPVSDDSHSCHRL
jgi:hypothetical protein